MKYVFWILGILVVLVMAVFGLQMAASERVEVVELHTLDAQSQPVTTRLWVVDYDGHPYLRGDDTSGWVQRLMQQEVVEVTRGNTRANYRWQIQPANIGAINRLMREKYTWGDQVITVLVGSRENSNASELTRVD